MSAFTPLISVQTTNKLKTAKIYPDNIDWMQGRIQDFKLGGGALKKIAPSGGRCENFWGISCEKSRFYPQKIIFFPILGGARAGCAPPPESAPGMIDEINTYA